jgi:hypothetical protein
MSEPAIRCMTLEEFHGWDDGTDTYYELIDGVLVARAPPQKLILSSLCASFPALMRPWPAGGPAMP